MIYYIGALRIQIFKAPRGWRNDKFIYASRLSFDLWRFSALITLEPKEKASSYD